MSETAYVTLNDSNIKKYVDLYCNSKSYFSGGAPPDPNVGTRHSERNKRKPLDSQPVVQPVVQPPPVTRKRKATHSVSRVVKQPFQPPTRPPQPQYLLEHLQFPEEIGKWDVSEVKNMSYLFSDPDEGISNFNEDISGWNVSNVENMNHMFFNCRNFNQNINGWIVSNVRNMNSMFNNCTKFNSPLNSWNVSNVTDMEHIFFKCKNFNQDLRSWHLDSIPEFNDDYLENMFLKCSKMTPDYKPRSRQGVVDATHVHKASANIDYEKLIHFFINDKKDEKEIIKSLFNEILDLVKTKNGEELKKIIIGYFENLKIIIDKIADSDYKTDKKEKEKNEFIEINTKGLNKILDKLILVNNFADYKPDLFIPCICLTLNYVENNQSSTFQRIYLETFLNDNLHAYEGEGTQSISCVKGILERILMSLLPACIATHPDSEDCKTLTKILHNNIETTLPEYILEWYAFHNRYKPNHFSEEDYSNTEFMENNLKEYLNNKFPSRTDKDNELINKEVKKNTEYIGYDKSAFLSGLEPIIFEFISTYPNDHDSINLRKYLRHKFPKKDRADEEIGPDLTHRINRQVAEYEMRTAKGADDKALSQEYDVARYFPHGFVDKTEGKGPTKMGMEKGGTKRRNVRRKTKKNVRRKNVKKTRKNVRRKTRKNV